MHLVAMPAPAADPSLTAASHLAPMPTTDRLSPARRALLSLALTALVGATKSEPREPEGQRDLRPTQGPRGQA